MINEGKIYEQLAILAHWQNRLNGLVIQLKMAGGNIPAELKAQKDECIVAIKAATAELERLLA